MKRRTTLFLVIFHTCALCLSLALLVGNVLACVLFQRIHWITSAAIGVLAMQIYLCYQKGADDFIAHLTECAGCRSNILKGTAPSKHEDRLSLN